MFIAEKIIELYSQDSFYCIAFAPIDNKKYRYYYNKLKEKCSHSCFIIDDYGKNRLNKILLLARIKFFDLSNRNKEIKKIFAANFNNDMVYFFLDSTKSELYTFDDGTANILEDSFCYKNQIGRLSTILRKLFGKNKDSVRDKIVKHYTLFSGFKNISSNLHPISLFNEVDNEESKEGLPELRVFLGQPIFESDAQKNIAIIESVIKKHTITHYFPHPRELYTISSTKYVDTPLIFEDWVVQNSKKYSKINIYTFFSSAALNLVYHKNIEVYVIPVDGFEKELELMKRFPVKIIS